VNLFCENTQYPRANSRVRKTILAGKAGGTRRGNRASSQGLADKKDHGESRSLVSGKAGAAIRRAATKAQASGGSRRRKVAGAKSVAKKRGEIRARVGEGEAFAADAAAI
jgi:hypothetical protein